MQNKKALKFRGDAKKRYDAFPTSVKVKAGYELYLVQIGEQPADFKPMPSIGPGVEELRVRDERNGAYRVIYIARLAHTVYVLHAFQKKTQKTEKQDIDLAKQRLSDLLKDR